MAGYIYPGKKPAKRNLALEQHEREVTSAPDFYVATIFRGIGKFDRWEAKTLEFARAAARLLIGDGNRPASIYAVKGPRDVLIEVVQPKKDRTHETMESRARR